MSTKIPGQKKALKKGTSENQSDTYKETLKDDFQFIMNLLVFGAEHISQTGELDVQELLFLDAAQLTLSQCEIIQNFQRYVMIDKYGGDGVVNVEIIDGDNH